MCCSRIIEARISIKKNFRDILMASCQPEVWGKIDVPAKAVGLAVSLLMFSDSVPLNSSSSTFFMPAMGQSFG